MKVVWFTLLFSRCSGFGITYEVIGSPLPSEITMAMDKAIRKWESIILTDVGIIPPSGDLLSRCSHYFDDSNLYFIKANHGLHIYLSSGGCTGNTLGFTVPCATACSRSETVNGNWFTTLFGRTGDCEYNQLPMIRNAVIKINPLLVGPLYNSFDILFHEIGHGLGYGFFYEYNLLDWLEVYYTGDSANNEYKKFKQGSRTPIEQRGLAGTKGSHWDQLKFGDEIMCGYANLKSKDIDTKLSSVSIASFMDIGHIVNMSIADEVTSLPILSKNDVPGRDFDDIDPNDYFYQDHINSRTGKVSSGLRWFLVIGSIVIALLCFVVVCVCCRKGRKKIEKLHIPLAAYLPDTLACEFTSISQPKNCNSGLNFPSFSDAVQ